MRKIRKLDVACPNKHCKAYNKVGLRNIVRNGFQSNGTQKYKCTECGRNLVRTINTPFFIAFEISTLFIKFMQNRKTLNKI